MNRPLQSIALLLALCVVAPAWPQDAKPEQIIFENFNSGCGKWQTSGSAFTHMSWKNPDLFPDDQSLPFRGEIVGIKADGIRPPQAHLRRDRGGRRPVEGHASGGHAFANNKGHEFFGEYL